MSRVVTDEQQISNIVLHERVGPLHVEIITSDVLSLPRNTSVVPSKKKKNKYKNTLL